MLKNRTAPEEVIVMPASHPCLARSSTFSRGIGFALWILSASMPYEARAGVSVWTGTPRLGLGVSSMSAEHSSSLLVDYFKTFLEDRDIEAFRERVAARYNEGTLGRILAGSPSVAARRAAVVSLGLLASFEQSNAVLGRSLKDSDAAVRGMAEHAALDRLVPRRYPREQSVARPGPEHNQEPATQ